MTTEAEQAKQFILSLYPNEVIRNIAIGRHANPIYIIKNIPLLRAMNIDFTIEEAWINNATAINNNILRNLEA